MRKDAAEQFAGLDAEPAQGIGHVVEPDIEPVAAVIGGDKALAAPETGHHADKVVVGDPVLGVVAVVAAHGVVGLADAYHAVQDAGPVGFSTRILSFPPRSIGRILLPSGVLA